jgi:hypothetical protein
VQGAFGSLVLNVQDVPAADCPTGNDGFEAGIIDDDFIPCWQTVDLDGSFGSWCTQAGGLAPGGPCEGSFAAVEAPPEGTHAAMAGQGGPGAHVLYRCGYLASDTVSFELYLNNQAVSGFATAPSLNALDFNVPNQQFRADLISAGGMALDPFTVGGDVLANLYQTQAGDALESGYTTVVADVEMFRDREVCLRFAEADNQGFFNVGVDAVAIVLNEEAPATPTPTATSTLSPTATPTLTPPTATPRPAAPCADVDGNGKVNIKDLVRIARHIPRKRFDARYDVNGDGRINIVDVLIAFHQLGTRCEA